MMKRFLSVLVILAFSFLFSYQYNVKSAGNIGLTLSHSQLDFHQRYQGETPSFTFYIFHFYEQHNLIHGTISSSDSWIQLSGTEFQGIKTEIIVTLTLKNLSPGVFGKNIFQHWGCGQNLGL